MDMFVPSLPTLLPPRVVARTFAMVAPLPTAVPVLHRANTAHRGMGMHTIYPLRSSLLAILASILLSACAATMGHTTRKAVEMDKALINTPMNPVQLKTVDVDSAGIQLLSVGVKPWGRFDADDLQNIRGSLEDTLAAATRSRGSSATGSELQIHLVIRGYFVAASNNAGGVLAVVDWCAADQGAHVLYQEVFYASHAVRLVGTLGGEKDVVDQAIVRRVAETSLLLSSGASTNGLPRKVKDTYDQFNEAVAVLPSDFESMGLVGAGPSSSVNLVMLFIPNTPSTDANWQSTKVEKPIDWSQRLETKSAQ